MKFLNKKKLKFFRTLHRIRKKTNDQQNYLRQTVFFLVLKKVSPGFQLEYSTIRSFYLFRYDCFFIPLQISDLHAAVADRSRSILSSITG